MTQRAQAILHEALALSLEERAIETPAEVEAAWAAEIETRARRVMAGESKGVAWEDVRSRAEAALRKP